MLLPFILSVNFVRFPEVQYKYSQCFILYFIRFLAHAMPQRTSPHPKQNELNSQLWSHAGEGGRCFFANLELAICVEQMFARQDPFHWPERERYCF